MHSSIKNYEDIIKLIKQKIEDQNSNKFPNIIAVTKTFALDDILPLIEYGHLDYGENKVQEAIDKWSEIKIRKPGIKLHLIGKLQTNKVKFAIKIFDFIHSVDSIKLAKKIGESSKVAVRNIRRDGIEQYKKMEKDKEIGEDDSKKLQSDVENLTSEHIKMIDSIVLEKEADLSKV